jgi:hypothetical protein
MSTFWLAAVLVATGAVGVATMISAIGTATFVLTTGPLAYRVTLVALLCVTVFFEVVMVIFGVLGVLDKATQVVTVLTSAFTVVGALVGSYFGVQVSSDITYKKRGAIEKAKNITERALGEMDPEASRRVVRDTSRTTP